MLTTVIVGVGVGVGVLTIGIFEGCRVNIAVGSTIFVDVVDGVIFNSSVSGNFVVVGLIEFVLPPHEVKKKTKTKIRLIFFIFSLCKFSCKLMDIYLIKF